MTLVTKTLRNIEHIWPSGTSVSLYARTMRDGAPAASGAAIATAAVTGGALVFSNVPDDVAGLVAVGAGKTVSTGAGKLSWASAH